VRTLLALLALVSMPAISQGTAQGTASHELIGQLGARTAVLNLHLFEQPDGSARVTGDYYLLPTMQQRYLEGERSKQLGVVFLKEGNTPIFFGRPPAATLQGTWSGGVFKGQRYGAAGQQRESFQFAEKFPPMDAYGATVKCEMAEGRYSSTLAYAVEAGRLKSFEWRSRVSPGDHPCAVSNLEQRPHNGGLRFASGKCSVTLRDLGEFVRVVAEGCGESCGSQGYLEPALVDRRGNCSLLRPQR
jgi:hypothetical protein